MATVQIELIVNDKGIVTGVKKAKDLSDAADQAMKSVQGLGNSSASLSVLGREAGEAAVNVRSLTTKILALIGAYKALQSVGSYINRIFDFSSSLESSQIAIASVIGATNKITDAQGRKLEGAEKFNAAQQISAKLMDEIQIRALETTATFDELVSGVSGIIAPATKAGIAIEKLPKFAVTAAQAMAAMKIPANQMRTEIESLLSGNINKVQDILATNLGITGEMVKNWQKQGTLIEELEKRLTIFAEAGETTAQSWAGLKNNLQDAYDYLSAKTGKGIFEGAKQSYREFLDLLVNTKGGKLGVGEDIENIVAKVQQLQNEIGHELISVTREFIGYVRELNNPGNLDELESKLKDIWGAAKTGIGAVKAVGGAIATLIADVIEGWQMLPEPIREYGLLMALLGGKRIKVAFAALAYANKGYETIKPLLSGDLSANDIDKLKTQYGEAFKTNTLQGFNKQIAQLEGNTKALREIQLDEEVKKWSASFDELVKKEKMTTGEAAANIERLKTAMSKSVENKDAQTSLSFIKEYSQLSGDYSQNQKYLLEMLDAEEKIYRDKLPVALQPYIEKWKELKKLQEARDPLSGSIRGLRSYSNEAMNLAKGIESAWTNGFQGMEDALVKFTMSGKLSFSDMANSIISDLMRIAIRSSITGPLASGLGSFFSGLGGGWATSAETSGAVDNAIAWVHHDGGMVGSGVAPTRAVSPYDYLNAPRFHSGGGLFKRDEYPAILQYGERVLNRQETVAYNARDWAGRDLAARGGNGGAAAAPQVTVNIHNNTSEEITQQTRTDNRGNRNIEITVGNMVAGQAMKPGTTMNRALRMATGAQQQATRR